VEKISKISFLLVKTVAHLSRSKKKAPIANRPAPAMMHELMRVFTQDAPTTFNIF
jgi:hypothetical protein